MTEIELNDVLTKNATFEDGTLCLDDYSVKLEPGNLYRVHIYDTYGNSRYLGLYKFDDRDHQDTYVFKACEWQMGRNYNMLLIPFELLDRYVFETHLS